MYFSHYKVLRYSDKFIIIFFFKDYNIKNFFFNFLKKFGKKNIIINNKKVNNSQRVKIKKNFNTSLKDNNRLKLNSQNKLLKHKNNNIINVKKKHNNIIKTKNNPFTKIKGIIPGRKGMFSTIKDGAYLYNPNSNNNNSLTRKNLIFKKNKNKNHNNDKKHNYLSNNNIYNHFRDKNVITKSYTGKSYTSKNKVLNHQNKNININNQKKIIKNKKKINVFKVQSRFFVKARKLSFKLKSGNSFLDKNLLSNKTKKKLNTKYILNKYYKSIFNFLKKRNKVSRKKLQNKLIIKKFKRNFNMINYFLASKYNYNKVSISNIVLRKKLLIVFNMSLFYYLGYNRYKKFILERYKNTGLNLRKNILYLESYYNNYLFNLINFNFTNLGLIKTKFLITKPKKYRYNHNIYNLFPTKSIDRIVYRIKIYNFLILNMIKYIFLLYKKTFFKFSGLLKVNYLSNCCVYIYLLKSNYMTATLITDYISRNLKIGHSLNKIIFPLLRYLYDKNKNVYLG